MSLLLAGRQLERVRSGESGARVWRCTHPGRAAWYLKVAALAQQLGLDREADCMRWMREAGLQAPPVLDYRRESGAEYLLTEGAVGAPASDEEWCETPERVATALGRGLARLHSTDISACPFDRRVARQLDEARARITIGAVREDDFDASRLGRSASDVFAELLSMVPAREDLVFVHGDYCLPNVLLAEVGGELRVTGLVDCARAGIGDRHQDLALAIRSLSYNFGDDLADAFLGAYDGPPVDSRALEFFTILDEFF